MEDFEIHGHGKASEVPCQDCGGTGKNWEGGHKTLNRIFARDGTTEDIK